MIKYLMPEKFHFLQGKQPIDKIGKTIFIYDITGDAGAHEQMAQEYAKQGFEELALRETLKVKELR